MDAEEVEFVDVARELVAVEPKAGFRLMCCCHNVDDPAGSDVDVPGDDGNNAAENEPTEEARVAVGTDGADAGVSCPRRRDVCEAV
jgi:hypothetical protein